MTEKSQHEQLAEERRAFNEKIERLRSEFVPSRDIDLEYRLHQDRIAAILGPDNQPCVGSSGGPKA